MGPACHPSARIIGRASTIPRRFAIVNGAGEQIWRPLLNPERLQFSVFVDKGPKGFGLIQKERSFASYQDIDQQFEKRPSLWIEPLGDWGEGSIDLIELPAPEEINENIVCFWRPKDGLGPGIGHRYRYRMHWCWSPPIDNKKATVQQTRVGETRAGEIAFVVDFANTELCEGCNAATIMPNVTASAGEVRNPRLAAGPSAADPAAPVRICAGRQRPRRPARSTCRRRKAGFRNMDFSLGAIIGRSLLNGPLSLSLARG